MRYLWIAALGGCLAIAVPLPARAADYLLIVPDFVLLSSGDPSVSVGHAAAAIDAPLTEPVLQPSSDPPPIQDGRLSIPAAAPCADGSCAVPAARPVRRGLFFRLRR